MASLCGCASLASCCSQQHAAATTSNVYCYLYPLNCSIGSTRSSARRPFCFCCRYGHQVVYMILHAKARRSACICVFYFFFISSSCLTYEQVRLDRKLINQCQAWLAIACIPTRGLLRLRSAVHTRMVQRPWTYTDDHVTQHQPDTIDEWNAKGEEERSRTGLLSSVNLITATYSLLLAAPSIWSQLLVVN